jgi:hypothetical protein
MGERDINIKQTKLIKGRSDKPNIDKNYHKNYSKHKTHKDGRDYKEPDQI